MVKHTPLADKPMLDQMRSYLHETLRVRAEVIAQEDPAQQPTYVSELFDLWHLRIAGKEVHGVVDKNGAWTPSRVAVAMKRLVAQDGHPAVFITSRIGSAQRDVLITRGLPFVAPEKQVYLPFLGMVVERQVAELPNLRATLAPATQALVIHALRHPDVTEFTAPILREQLQYEPMSLIRSFDELETRGLADAPRQGMTRRCRFRNRGSDLWEQAKPLLRTPVRRRVWVTSDRAIQNDQGESAGVPAGLTALSHESNIAAPSCPVFAVPPAGWFFSGIKATRKDVFFTPYTEPGAIEVETWIYHPRIFSAQGPVDPFNLYLSLRDDTDARVQEALDKLEAGLW